MGPDWALLGPIGLLNFVHHLYVGLLALCWPIGLILALGSLLLTRKDKDGQGETRGKAWIRMDRPSKGESSGEDRAHMALMKNDPTIGPNGPQRHEIGHQMGPK